MNRTDEALETGADVISTACPYCMIMLDDAVKTRERADDVQVLDIAQILERSLVAAAAPAPVATETAGEGADGAGEAESPTE
jgi:hypothetical protein